MTDNKNCSNWKKKLSVCLKFWFSLKVLLNDEIEEKSSRLHFTFDFMALVKEMLLEIFNLLTAKDIVRISTVCKQWNSVANTMGLWKNKMSIEFPKLIPFYENYLRYKELDISAKWKQMYRTAKVCFFSPFE